MGDVFKTYDIRGTYPDELDETLAGKIGAAFVRLLNASRIVITKLDEGGGPGTNPDYQC